MGKQELPTTQVPISAAASAARTPASQLLRAISIALAVVGLVFINSGGLKDLSFKPCGMGTSKQATPATVISANRPLVPFEAHIMSKCPDSKICLKEMVLPAMQRVYSKVNFTLSYVGTPTENDGVECKHGASECMGNIIELCAAQLYPDPKIYLGFTMCLTRDYEDIPDRSLVEDCALEHGLDFQNLNECASTGDGFGIGLLRDSVMRSTDAGVIRSCTVRVNNEIYCVHDGSWIECKNGPGVNDLVIAIEKLYSSP